MIIPLLVVGAVFYLLYRYPFRYFYVDHLRIDDSKLTSAFFGVFGTAMVVLGIMLSVVILGVAALTIYHVVADVTLAIVGQS